MDVFSRELGLLRDHLCGYTRELFTRLNEVANKSGMDGANDWAEVQTRARLYRSHLDVPKTWNSRRKVALPDGVSADIAEWRSVSPSVEPDAWVFLSETVKTPLSRDNVWRRAILPKLQEVGLGWVNFQVMRRTHSTLMNQLKVEPKLVADQLGHTLDVNQNVYTIPDLTRRRDAVNQLENAVHIRSDPRTDGA